MKLETYSNDVLCLMFHVLRFMDKLAKFSAKHIQNNFQFKPGDVVKVHQKIKEEGKERIQVFDGLVISRKHGKGLDGTFTVRKVVAGVGVERTYALHSPLIAKLEVVKSTKTRRSKLYYVRTAKGKRARLKDAAVAVAIQPAETNDSEEESAEE